VPNKQWLPKQQKNKRFSKLARKTVAGKLEGRRGKEIDGLMEGPRDRPNGIG